MASNSGGSSVWQPGIAVLMLAAFGFVATNQAPATAPPIVGSPPVEVARGETPPSASWRNPDAWAEDVWGAADLFRRLLGDVPRRERNPPVALSNVVDVRFGPQPPETDALRASRAAARVKRAVADLNELKTRVRDRAVVHLMVATVQDYHDSHVRWRADEVLSTIQAAAGHRDYSLFDFYLPDWRPDVTDARTRSLRDHEREPGALLFQKSDGGQLTLLLVLLVPETPTAGVHGAVLRTAIRFARDWGTDARSDGTVRIVGPTASGSIPSIRLALEDVGCGGSLKVSVVSGMATSRGNRDTLLAARCPAGRPGTLEIEYHTTVHFDGDLLRVLHDQLVRIEPDWQDGNGVALLVESNTAWGAALDLPAENAEPSRRSAPSCRNGIAPTGIDALPCARKLPFPLHVSRLSNPGESGERPSSAPSVPSWASPLLPRGLAVADTITPADALPSFTPNTTATVVKAMLHDTLETLARGEFGAVGILATDIRDHLFLAREISKVAPGVLMFGTEPHMLMLHPDFQPYVRGTLMASSYPTHAHTQRLTGDAGGMQFASMGAQGTFNAVLAQLTSFDNDGTGKAEGLVDFRTPRVPGADVNDTARPGPVPWVVVVARDAFLPLAAGTTRETPSEIFVSASDVATASADGYLLGDWQTPSLLAGVGVLVFLHLVAVAVAQLRPVPGLPAFSPPARCSPRQASEHRLLTLACASALALSLAWQLRLWETIVRGWASASGAEPLIHALFVVCASGAAAISLWAAAVSLRRLFSAWGTEPVTADLTSLAPTALALAMTAAFLLYLQDGERWTGSAAVFHVERTLGMASFTSPLPVIVALLGLVYGWAFWGLRSLHRHVVDGTSAEPLFTLLGGGRRGLPAELKTGAQSTIHPMGGFMPALVLVVPLLMLMGLPPRTHSVDGVHFAWVLALGSVLGIMALGIELGQAVWLGRGLKESLDYLRGHALGPAIERLALEPAEWGMAVEPGEGNTGQLIATRLDGMRRRLDLLRADLQGERPVQAKVVHGHRRRPIAELPQPEAWEEVAGGRADIRSSDIHQLSGVLKQTPDVSERTLPLLRRTTWATALAVTGTLVPAMECRFWGPRRPYPADAAARGFLQDTEHFVALVSAVMIRTLVVRIVRGLSIAAVIGGTLMLAHLFYTFPGRQFWLFADFAALSVVALMSVRQLLALERDHLLSKLWSSTPGRLDMTSGLVWRAVATTALPLVTLVAAFFPEIGGRYLAWVEPLRQLMPVP